MRFSENFEAAKNMAVEAAQTAAAKAKELAAVAKANIAIYAEEDKVKKAEIELGKLYYAEKGAAPDGAYAAACEKITAAKAAIEVNNERIAELKESEDGEVQTSDFEVDPVQEAEPAADEPAAEAEEPAAEEPKTEE